MPNDPGYRRDIDGLRALAVSAVVLYHCDFGAELLPGGFLGVDLFFVISGYLITQQIVNQLAHGRFSLRDFYLRRLRRLAPALLAVLGASLLAGYFFLLPADYESLATSTPYALLALSNFYFLNETDYFDQAAELQPLLHSWSLSVEEQFYLIWPALLVLTFKKCGRRWLPIAIAVIALSSLAYSLALSQWDAKVSFYSPLSRAWQLGIGGLVAVVPVMQLSRGGQRLIQIFALLLITAAFSMATIAMASPGWGTLLPTVGAALLLQSAPKDRMLSGLLCSGPVRYLGLISYSLYLWHWPVIVYAKHYNAGIPLTIREEMGLIGLSLGLAALSYHYIERPFRRQARRAQWPKAALFASICGLTFATLPIVSTEGITGRQPDSARAIQTRDEMWHWEPRILGTGRAPRTQNFGNDWDAAAARIILWGDSHAEHLAPLLEQSMLQSRRPTAISLKGGCPPTINGPVFRALNKSDQFNEHCASQNARTLAMLWEQRHNIDRVILAAAWASRWEHFRNHPDQPEEEAIATQHQAISELTAQINAMGIEVAIVGQVPLWPQDPHLCLQGQTLGLLRASCDQQLSQAAMPAAYSEVHKTLATLAGGQVSVLLPDQQLCSQSRCTAVIAGEFIYRDSNHLRRNLKPAVKAALVERLGLAELIAPSRNSTDLTASVNESG